MEKTGPADRSKQGKMEQPKSKLSGWGHCIMRTRSRHWPVACTANVYSDSKDNVHVRPLLDASDKSDNSTQYLERPVSKLVVLVENNN